MKRRIGLIITAVVLAVALLTTSSLSQPAVKLEYVKARQIYVPVGTEVGVYVKLKAVGGDVSGILKVIVKKDYGWALPDQVHKELSTYVYIPSGQTKEVYVGTFVASDKTGGGFGQVREYFSEIYFNGQRLNPWETDPDTRPFVKTY